MDNKNRIGLGKGLSAILGEIEEETTQEVVESEETATDAE